MDIGYATHNDYKVPILVLTITSVALYFVISINWSQHDALWKDMAAITLSFVILMIMLLHSYFRIKLPMMIDLFSLCENADANEDAVINIDNPIYINLSFLYYYIRIYIQAILMLTIILSLFYIFFFLLNTQVERPIMWDFYSEYKFLYPVAGIEAVGFMLFGGKFSIDKETKNGLLHFPSLRDNSSPDKIFQIFMPDKLHVHYIPFGIGCLSCIAYALIMLNGSKESICEDKDAFIYKFRMGIVTVVTITILLYAMQCVKQILAKVYT